MLVGEASVDQGGLVGVCKGAGADVVHVCSCLCLCLVAGYSQDRFYIHCDGALFGMMMPFIKEVGGWVEAGRGAGI